MCGQIADVSVFSVKHPLFISSGSLKCDSLRHGGLLPYHTSVAAVLLPCLSSPPPCYLAGYSCHHPPYSHQFSCWLHSSVGQSSPIKQQAGLVVERQRRTSSIRSDAIKRQGQELGMGRKNSSLLAAVTCCITSAASENIKVTSYSQRSAVFPSALAKDPHLPLPSALAAVLTGTFLQVF